MALRGRLAFVLSIAVSALLWASAALAWPPRPEGVHFIDETKSIKPDKYEAVEAALTKLSFDCGCDVRLGLFKTMGGTSAAGAGQELVQAWGMGKDFNGRYILMAVFPYQREMRTEYSKAFSGTGMDTYLQEITFNVITARFLEGDYAEGIIAGTEAFEQAIKGTYKTTLVDRPPVDAGKTGGILSLLVALAAMVFGGWRRYTHGVFGDSIGSKGSSSFGSHFGSSAYTGGGGGCTGKW